MTKIISAASMGGLSVLCAGVLLVKQPAHTVGPVADVRTGSFTQSLVERGAVGSSRLLLYGSSIAGVQVKIADIVPEGRNVVPGDVLVRFDAGPFEQNLAREEAGLRQAEAELLRAREELRLEQLRAEGDAAQGRQQVDYARAEVDNQASGKGRVSVAEAEAAEADAARELARARTTYDDMRPMLDRGFITRAELDRAAQALARAEDQATLARLRREALVGFERPAATARSKGDLESARQAAVRQEEIARARRSERDAAMRIAASHVDELRARTALLRQQIERCVVRADAPGMVVYRDLFFGSDKRKPQVGDEVWSNQPLIALPDVSRLTVDTRIREADLHHVAAGRAVTVTIPAYPDLRLKGTVSLIGALAEEDAARAGSKFFPVTIALDDRDSRVRTGMTARVEIVVSSLERATLVPVQAVFDVGGQPTVFIVRPGGAVPRPVRVAGANDRDAAVTSGLAEGDVVTLSDPRAKEPR